jgi:hypothetical protein
MSSNSSNSSNTLKFDGSAEGGDASSHATGLRIFHGKVTGGDGVAGDAKIGSQRQIADADIKLRGKGGSATTNRGGETQGGRGQGGSLTLD